MRSVPNAARPTSSSPREKAVKGRRRVSDAILVETNGVQYTKTIFLARDRAGHQFLFLLLFQPCLDSFQPEKVLFRPLLQTHLDIPYRVQNPRDDDVLQTVDPSLSRCNRLPSHPHRPPPTTPSYP